jgi:hypothetical protein
MKNNYDVLIRRNRVDPGLGYVVEVVNEEDSDDVVQSMYVYASRPLAPQTNRSFLSDVRFAKSLDAAATVGCNEARKLMRKYNV